MNKEREIGRKRRKGGAEKQKKRTTTKRWRWMNGWALMPRARPPNNYMITLAPKCKIFHSCVYYASIRFGPTVWWLGHSLSFSLSPVCSKFAWFISELRVVWCKWSFLMDLAKQLGKRYTLTGLGLGSLINFILLWILFFIALQIVSQQERKRIYSIK